MRFETLPHPPPDLDLTLPDIYIFGPLKDAFTIRKRIVRGDTGVQNAVQLATLFAIKRYVEVRRKFLE